MAARSKKKVTKLKLSDLLGKEGKANADLHKNDPEKRKHHLRHRSPRHRLITPKGVGYHRPLSGNPKMDVLYNEVAREWINNGFRPRKAYAAVFGVSLRSAKDQAYRLFGSSWFRAKLASMLQGTDGELAELPKEYLLQKLVNILEMNILDYINDDGLYLTVPELRALPIELQVLLDNFTMVNTVRHVALKDADGVVIKIGDAPYMVEVREQKVHLKLPDKLKTMETLAKAMEWISTHSETTINVIDASVMQNAETRVKELRRDYIEGSAEHVTPD